MPRILKNDAITLLEGGIEAYSLGLYGIILPSSRNNHRLETKYAPVLGLFGTSIELTIKACLVQVKGIDVVYKDNDVKNNVYKYASDVIDEFTDAIKHDSGDYSFLYNYISTETVEYKAWKSKILFFLSKFKLLQALRANGFHAAKGCSYEIAVTTANEIHSFFQHLSKSKKLQAYIKNIPAPADTVRDREIRIEDLRRRVNLSENAPETVACIRNMFLVLPYIPEIPPDWVEVFERVAVAPPTESDLSYLVKTLTDAHSIYLLKNRGGKEGIPVRIDNSDPNAVPIAIEKIKRTLSSLTDKFYNDVMTANTRFDEKRLDLPLDETIMDLYSVGLCEARILSSDSPKLTAQQTWPFVASAYSTQGSPRPIWFMIKSCDEIDRLIDYINKIYPIANGYYKRRFAMLLKLLEGYKDNEFVHFEDNSDKFIKAMLTDIHADKSINSCPFPPEYLKKYTFSNNANAVIKSYISADIDVGTAIVNLIQSDEWCPDDRYAVQRLLDICCKNILHKDALICAYKSDRVKSYQSKIRRTIFYMDLMTDGPDI